MNKKAKINMINQRFGVLTVISEVLERNKNGHILYKVRCDCGKEKQVLGSSLRSGSSKSCDKCTLLTGSHGMWKSKEFSIWKNMKDRCYNPNNSRYLNYGGRGIKVCDRWLNSFSNFYSDMGNANGLSIDRINVNGNYEPKNCKWANAKIQARNRTNNIIFTYNQESKCAAEWCEILNMPSSTFRNRINRGWDIKKIIETPINSKNSRKKLK